MKLATLKSDHKDGRLVVVSRDLRHAVDAADIAPSLLAAIEHWAACAPQLQRLYDDLNEDEASGAFDFDPLHAAAPLPRAPQWCDGSAFLNHGRLMEKAFNIAPIPDMDKIPLMYQGGSDDMLGACDDVPLPDEARLAAAISRLAGDDALRDRLGIRAAEVVDRYSLPSVMDQWEALLKKVSR